MGPAQTDRNLPYGRLSAALTASRRASTSEYVSKIKGADKSGGCLSNGYVGWRSGDIEDRQSLSQFGKSVRENNHD
jgi:hypothetical protein